MQIQKRLGAAALHLTGTIVVALIAATCVFGIWYPFPYRDLAGGRDLFLLLVSVDLVCGPLLTLILFNSNKPKRELLTDLGLVISIQLVALIYGVWTVWQARPLYMAAEVDRFKLVSAPDLRGASLGRLPAELQPSIFSGPKFVAIREPIDIAERSQILAEVIDGGADFGERPSFYLPYTGDAARKMLARSKSLEIFLQKYPAHRKEAEQLAAEKGKKVNLMKYLPIVGRQDWIAILDDDAFVIGYLRGDGF